MIHISVKVDSDVFDVVIENEDGFFAFEFATKNGAVDFADRAADLFNLVGPIQITKPLTLSPAGASDSVGEQLPLGH